MARMSVETVAALRRAIDDPAVAERYWALTRRSLTPGECWLWTGAISGNGHGRFSVGDWYQDDGAGGQRRRTTVVIAHRFGFAIAYGVDELLNVPLISHRCDNPLCQLPDHWRISNHRANTAEYAYRRGNSGPLADTRGARGRARAVRDAARAGQDIAQAVLAGLPPVHRDQQELFTLDAPDGSSPHGRGEPWVG